MLHHRSFRQLLRDERGAMGIVFAFGSIPLVMISGLAVDYTRAASTRADIQNAADSAVLALGRNEKGTSNTETLKTMATAHIAAVLPDGVDFEVTSVSRENGKLALNVEGAVPTGLSAIFGLDELDLNVTSEVMWGASSGTDGGTVGKLEVALVLDNTGSMAQMDRMTEMKKAATALLDELQTSDPGLVKVAIVPFDTSVRVPTTYKTASWFKTEWWVNWFWQGCLTDRDQSYDVNDAPVTSAASTKYPPALCTDNNLATIQPLTDKFSDLYGKVNAMKPAGNTNITIGLAWGQTLLSSQEPFTQGAAASVPGVRKLMVLMTDGENTENRWSKSSSAIDERTELACAAVKDAGIQLYTVRLMDGDGALLQGCASEPESYYDVQNIADLVPTFKAIGQELSQLRLSR